MAEGDGVVQRPLAGVRILDLTRVLSGPYATSLLADLGADVVKVEQVGSGDVTRSWGPPFLEPGISTYFGSINRGKRSVAVDLGTAAGRQLLARLAVVSDVVVDNFTPGTAARLGADPDLLRQVNPAIVTCSISGFGSQGAFGGLPATEIVVEALSGAMATNGESDGPPVRFGIAMIDIASGLTAAVRILGAVLQARAVGATGSSEHIECSLYGTALAVLGTLVTSWSATGDEPRRWGTHHPTIAPYGAFPTADGPLVTGVIDDRSWPAFCEALELTDLAGRADLETNAGRLRSRREVEDTITRVAATKARAYWVARLRERRLLAAEVRTIGQAMADPATEALGLFVPLEGHDGVLAPRLDSQRHDDSAAPVPRLGAHTMPVLTELLGMEAAEVTQLASAGVVEVRAGG